MEISSPSKISAAAECIKYVSEEKKIPGKKLCRVKKCETFALPPITTYSRVENFLAGSSLGLKKRASISDRPATSPSIIEIVGALVGHSLVYGRHLPRPPRFSIRKECVCVCVCVCVC